MRRNSLQLRLSATLISLICAMGFQSWADEAYAYLGSFKTLYFCYDSALDDFPNGEIPYGLQVWRLNDIGVAPGWLSYGVRHVVFDSTFVSARPTNTYWWFFDMTDLTSITGIEFLNTSEVTDMSYMFYNCSNLTDIDLSHFDTRNVTDMSSMFKQCKKITSLDLSSFNTTNVTQMGSMFEQCTNLTHLDLRNFNTSQVTRMSYMFSRCTNLVSLDLSNFNTTSVTNMYDMFDQCTSLESINLDSFNTSAVTNMSGMFYHCNSLRTIIVGDEWNTDNVTSSDYMFKYSTNLVGGSGTTYDENHVDMEYARIDGGPDSDTPGYFTATTVEKYPLWIKGFQVTSNNQNNVLGDGKVNYNPSSNTLTLNEAKLQLTTNEKSLDSEIPGLIVNVKGVNTMSSLSDAVYFRESARLTGNGEFRVTTTSTGSGLTCALGVFKDLAVEDSVHVRAANNGSNGLGAWVMGNLSLESPTAQFRAYGKWFSLLLGSLNGVITEPEGGYVRYYEGFDTSTVYDSAGIIVNNAWVTIKGEGEDGVLGDVTGEGIVDVEDVNAAINIILHKKTAADYPGNADVTGEGIVDVEDVNSIINIILHKN
ncbi:MAG: BspA family leucine-rich repeat surface protein [Muribaculaceae bacterium]|nr:BspA family leucine-rich repeat surface protein [Muribaculaceae bacterium]